ncbi:hypothetical protein L4D00_24530 [Photobacterium swingsii]|uniref:hypothetical protein n=1 Tax=Photobacterium swingsii TaxID=680026 RepID=UPI003D13CC01
MKRFGCPICGYESIEVLDSFGDTTFEICDSCGGESGCDYDQFSTDEHLSKLRLNWLTFNNAQWWGDKSSKPADWDPLEQMAKAGINYETE